MDRMVLMKWKDTSGKSGKSVDIRFVNGLCMTIKQDHDEEEDKKYLWYVSVVDKNGNVVSDYLNEEDVYLDEVRGNYGSLMSLPQIERYVKKLSSMIL